MENSTNKQEENNMKLENARAENVNPDDLLMKAMDELENTEKLNLTADAKDDDDEIDPATEEEFAKFMSELNSASGMGQAGEPDQLAKMMSELMKGSMGTDENNPNGNPLKSMLDGLMDNLGKGDFDSVAQNLLREFMDKEILQEPLEEAKKNYEEYFAKNEKATDPKEIERFKEQYKCILDLIEVLDKDPQNKEKMIALFEKMHDFGLPPEGILNPLAKIQGNTGGTNPGGLPNLGGLPGMPGMNPSECNIF